MRVRTWSKSRRRAGLVGADVEADRSGVAAVSMSIWNSVIRAVGDPYRSELMLLRLSVRGRLRAG